VSAREVCQDPFNNSPGVGRVSPTGGYTANAREGF